MSERDHFIPIDKIHVDPSRVEPLNAILEQSHRITHLENRARREHMVLPFSKDYDFLAINVPSTYQQGMIPDGEEPPWGMLRVVVTAREKYGFNAGILDAHRLKLEPQEIADQIRKSRAKLIGLNPTSVNVSEARIVADICNDLRVHYILGGIHATLDPRIAKEDFPEAFAIVRGNGEVAIREILDTFHRGAIKSVNQGIYYWDQDSNTGSFYATKMRPGDVPIIQQDLYIEEPIYTHTVEVNGNEREIHEATLFVTDGCPFECTFCSSPIMVNRGGDIPYVRPETERIVDEVGLATKLGADAIHFLDDMAFIRGQNIKEFHRGISERGLLGKFIWRGLTRAPVVLRPDFDDDVMNMMRESGAWKIALGIESGSDEVLKRIKKQVTTDQVRRAVYKLSSYDIQVKGFFILGFPDETEDQMGETIRFIDELRSVGLTEISAFQFKPYPGTQEYADLVRSNPDVIKQLGYLKIKHNDLDGKAQDRADNHVWLPDDIKIADVPSGTVRSYVERTLENFYGKGYTTNQQDSTCI